jgi:hypothetical protein
VLVLDADAVQYGAAPTLRLPSGLCDFDLALKRPTRGFAFVFGAGAIVNGGSWTSCEGLEVS